MVLGCSSLKTSNKLDLKWTNIFEVFYVLFLKKSNALLHPYYCCEFIEGTDPMVKSKVAPFRILEWLM